MKYLISIVLLLSFMGCGSGENNQLTADTSAEVLQPVLSNEEAQPPKPPSL